MRYAFSDFVLDLDTRQLLRAGRVVPLSPKGLDLLELLLRERPRAVSRTRLRVSLWPRTHVGATSLHTLVSQVRAAIDDQSQEPRWIRTVQRFGYAFCGEAAGGEVETVAGLAAAARADSVRDACWLSTTEGECRLHEGDNVLGRDAALALRFDRPGVSRRHASIRVERGRAILTDLGSKNGTFVGETRIAGPTLLHDGDELRLGLRVTAVFRRAEGEETETEGG